MIDKEAFLSVHEDVVKEFLTRSDQDIYKQLFEFSQQGLAIVSPSGTLIKMNQKFCDILGCSEHVKVQDDYESSIQIEDLRLDQKELLPLFLGEIDSYKIEKELHSLLWISIHASILPFENVRFILLTIEDITSRKDYELRLNQELQFYNSFQVYNNLPIMSCDLEGNIVFANTASGIKLGYRKEELLHQSLKKMIVQQDIMNDLENKNIKLDGKPYTYVRELDIICKNEEILKIEMKFIPIFVDNKLEGIHVIFWEAKEYRNALHLIHHHNGLLFKYKKIEEKFVFSACAGSLTTRMNINPKKIIGRTLNDFLKGKELKRVENYYRQAWESGKVVSFEGIYLENTYYLVTLKPVLENNEVIEVVGTFTELTNLNHSQLRYQTILNNSIVGIFLYQDEKFNFVNSRLCEMYGYSQKEMINQNILDLFVQEERDKISTNLQKLKIGFINKLEMNSKGVHKNNSIINLKVQYSIIEFQEEPLIIGIINDVTEKKLQKMTKQSIVTQLAAGFAHEIRNPLTTLKGFVRMLELNSQSADESKRYIKIMNGELERIQVITDKFLSLAKPMVVNLEKQDLHEIIHDVISNMSQLFKDHNIDIKLKVATNLTYIRGDEELLKKTFRHIIRNSIEAMPDGGEIVVKIKSICNKLIVCVIDQGIGITSERLAKLGEPFYTTKEKGTGLGLMMCYKILEAHHGKIHISSRVNKGTTVEVYLPDMEGIYLN
ncbi:PAS domain S-box protein [Chengkuizengella axinellae]|uniref:histidine kinase n=1 Tax=Chengkuizengella axinellae TaxID=3064388 RepID=A0ABT9IX92_9BACL|nr:PAS domain S-box protein [Chengkuizengella sp. 2205SS18-9]MDP5273983.1 PAS domain S-box protein [Chengkuizengella sp. 2205SS18-9]